VLKLAVPMDVAAMIAPIIPTLLVAVTVAVATIVKTIVMQPRLYKMNVILGHLLRGYQRNNL
tara:strand:- start:524 stop:709 length:186 start_codon:yes stop_codon:yes gene_type:complete